MSRMTRGGYLLSAKELCMYDHLDRLCPGPGQPEDRGAHEEPALWPRWSTPTAWVSTRPPRAAPARAGSPGADGHQAPPLRHGLHPASLVRSICARLRRPRPRWRPSCAAATRGRLVEQRFPSPGETGCRCSPRTDALKLHGRANGGRPGAAHRPRAPSPDGVRLHPPRPLRPWDILRLNP